MPGFTIREATADDTAFLEDMLVEAANSPDQHDRSREETLSDPAVSHYVEGWPRPTDLGLVALDERGGRVGAAWLRFFSEDDPAYGYVRADVPELAVGVVGDRRGQGVGRALLRALEAHARDRGIEQISLSVERANPAAALYLARGYRVVERRDHAETMVLDLRTAPGG